MISKTEKRKGRERKRKKDEKKTEKNGLYISNYAKKPNTTLYKMICSTVRATHCLFNIKEACSA